jgi:hypothetical protein
VLEEVEPGHKLDAELVAELAFFFKESNQPGSEEELLLVPDELPVK